MPDPRKIALADVQGPIAAADATAKATLLSDLGAAAQSALAAAQAAVDALSTTVAGHTTQIGSKAAGTEVASLAATLAAEMAELDTVAADVAAQAEEIAGKEDAVAPLEIPDAATSLTSSHNRRVMSFTHADPTLTIQLQAAGQYPAGFSCSGYPRNTSGEVTIAAPVGVTLELRSADGINVVTSVKVGPFTLVCEPAGDVWTCIAGQENADLTALETRVGALESSVGDIETALATIVGPQ